MSKDCSLGYGICRIGESNVGSYCVPSPLRLYNSLNQFSHKKSLLQLKHSSKAYYEANK